ncbi:hypothetical protein DFJ58DRAFT_312579 [Suillus subalutaceus]|uniref:uncharacterized protein n=1 Tax=Suillus subalutaceus TaxID=48586 RepID=UPI001B862265|nr:uncharacterized protein DFJ58DRAFT_312579 [Suillus subalutaceus]KAG1858062.1 hypothetical protein DFJ58DRAFT_312579 [Suillus subalutaceus]
MNQSLSELGFQNYYQRLVDHSLISQSQASRALETPISSSSSDYPRCPICSHLLVTCYGCSNVTCDNSCCKGANLISFVSSCQSCFSTLATVKKCSQYDCSSRAHFTGGVICPDCVRPTDGHILCPCEDNWICGTCATNEKVLNHCGRCPKCQNYFCFFRCRYIDVCVDCRMMTLCNDCMEEDMSEEESSTATFLVATCEECRGRICTDCFNDCGSRCRSCLSVHCQDCVDYEECPSCGELMCLTCATEDGCRGCEVCRFSNNECWLPLTYRNKVVYAWQLPDTRSRAKSADSESTSSKC